MKEQPDAEPEQAFRCSQLLNCDVSVPLDALVIQSGGWRNGVRDVIVANDARVVVIDGVVVAIITSALAVLL